MVPQEIVEVLVSPFLDEMVEVVSMVSQKRVQQRSDQRGKVALAIDETKIITKARVTELVMSTGCVCEKGGAVFKESTSFCKWCAIPSSTPQITDLCLADGHLLPRVARTPALAFAMSACAGICPHLRRIIDEGVLFVAEAVYRCWLRCRCWKY